METKNIDKTDNTDKVESFTFFQRFKHVFVHSWNKFGPVVEEHWSKRRKGEGWGDLNGTTIDGSHFSRYCQKRTCKICGIEEKVYQDNY